MFSPPSCATPAAGPGLTSTATPSPSRAAGPRCPGCASAPNYCRCTAIAASAASTGCSRTPTNSRHSSSPACSS